MLHHRSLSRVGTLKTPAFVRHAHAEFGPDVKKKFVRMSVEATVCGFFFAFWWRYSHNEEKARYDRYYASLKAASDGD